MSLFSYSEMGALSVAPVVSSSSVSAVPADPCVGCYLRGLCGDECGRRVGRGYL